MNRLKLFLAIFIFYSSIGLAQSKDGRWHVSFVLSGHILIGAGYTYNFDDSNSIQATLYGIPIAGLPFAITSGYTYRFGGENWKPGIGLEYALITSPKLDMGRKYLSMLNFTPQLMYNFKNGQNLNGKFWLSYFLSKTNYPFAPTGIEMQWGF